MDDRVSAAESLKKLLDGNEDLPMSCAKNYAKGNLNLQKHVFRFLLSYSASSSKSVSRLTCLTWRRSR